MKQRIISLIIVVFSIICGIVTKDYYLGTLVLMCGLLNSYLASEKKINNYAFGALYCLLSGYVCLKNGLYGTAALSFAVYFPFQIFGFINWKKHMNTEEEVETRGFTLKNSIAIVSACIIGSLIIGFLLSQIPTQRLAFLDSASVMLNLCGIILMNLRFKECWWIWIVTNSVDLTIWIINFINKTETSTMMLLVSIGYFIINIIGLIKWNKTEKLSEK